MVETLQLDWLDPGKLMHGIFDQDISSLNLDTGLISTWFWTTWFSFDHVHLHPSRRSECMEMGGAPIGSLMFGYRLSTTPFRANQNLECQKWVHTSKDREDSLLHLPRQTRT